jgi:hypothetical protein
MMTASRRRPQSLLEIVQRLGEAAAQAKAEAEAAGPDEVDPWDLLDLDPAISGPAWERFMGKPAR